MKNVKNGAMVLPERGIRQQEGIIEDKMVMGRVLVIRVCHWRDWKILIEMHIMIIENGASSSNGEQNIMQCKSVHNRNPVCSKRICNYSMPGIFQDVHWCKNI